MFLVEDEKNKKKFFFNKKLFKLDILNLKKIFLTIKKIKP